MNVSNEVFKLLKPLNLVDRLKIIENILKDIRKENTEFDVHDKGYIEDGDSRLGILSLSGIISDEEADVLQRAVNESRKIEADEW